MQNKKWYNYLWIWSIIYFLLGFFNILFAWLGMIDFLVPLGFALFGGNKHFCNHYCGRGQLFSKIGGTCKCSRNKPTPKWLSSKWFRYGFLVFFLTMFGIMIFNTYLVAAGAETLKEAIKVLPQKYKDIVTEEDLDAVKKLGVLLRIAESLDRTHCGMVTGVNSDVLGDSVIMKTIVAGDAALEIRDAEMSNPEFKRAFKKNLEIL